ncbi:MAG: pantoate--beta-alanine ligase [Bacteroidota bacterium]
MKIFEQTANCTEWVRSLQKKNKSIGFVPTMGALHEGHLSLIKKSIEENDYTISSIFVNPTQFNDKGDLEKYPRTLQKDCDMLANTGCSAVFCPSVDEMYPKGKQEHETYNLGGLDNVMEGKHRPGHFNGVAMIIDRLFRVVPANRAYFGKKDFQQLAIIKHLVKKLGFNIEIIACPTVREKDGLAMSSRNMLLTPEYRKAAPEIFRALSGSKNYPGIKSVDETKKWVVNEINKNPLLAVEYFEIVNDVDLQPVASWTETPGITGCIAVHAGDVRLIDNIQYNS